MSWGIGWGVGLFFSKTAVLVDGDYQEISTTTATTASVACPDIVYSNYVIAGGTLTAAVFACAALVQNFDININIKLIES